MKYHLTGYGVSALVHTAVLLAALPVMLWQDKQGKMEEPQPVQLSLAQFVLAPPAPVAPPAPPPVAAPPKPAPKPVEKPKPQPKPVEKPKTQPKPVEKPKPKPEPPPREIPQAQPPTPQPKPEAQPPTPQPKPVKPAVAPSPAPVPARPAASEPRTAAPAEVADNKAAEAAYKARLQNLIATRKQYPRMAVKAEVEGSVVVSFTVMPNGSITGAQLVKSAGNDWLDKAALQAVSAASGALPFPAEIRKPQWTFSVTVNFTLD